MVREGLGGLDREAGQGRDEEGHRKRVVVKKRRREEADTSEQ